VTTPLRDAAPIRTSALVVALALVAGSILMATVGLRPTPVVSADAAPTAFSAERAVEALAAAVAGIGPHPVGSDAAAVFRERLALRLDALGLPVRRVRGWACAARFGVCAPVTNLVATLPGREHTAAVVLMAHTDSVTAGPGVADDGAGVAVLLEVARAVAASPPPMRPIRLVLTDGEEAGLLGATAFVDADPQATDTFAVVNIDNRGTCGPSLMFETGADNAGVVEAYARSVHRPHASSLFVDIYRRLPNDTDFSVLRRAGFTGLNFAFLEGAARYHTPLDDLVHLDPRSVQDHGNAVLAVVQELADSTTLSVAGDAVYSDIFGRVLVRWGAAWGPLLAALALALVLAGLVVGAGRPMARLTEAGFGLVAWGLAVVLGLGLGLALARIVSALTGDPAPWRAHPFPLRLGVWSAAFAASLAAASWLHRRAGLWGLVGGAWLGWAALAAVLAVRAPGASIVVLLPALIAGAVLLGAGLAGRGSPDRGAVAAAIGGTIAGGVTGFPLALLGESALGFSLTGAGFITASLLLPATSLAPLVASSSRRRLAIAVAAGTLLIGGIGAILVPSADEDSPGHLNLLYVEDTDSGTASWVASGDAVDTRHLPPELTAAAPFTPTLTPVLPWLDRKTPLLAARAPAASLPAARLEPLASWPVGAGRRRIRARLVAPPSLPNVTLLVPVAAGPHTLRAGAADAGPGRRRAGHSSYARWELVAVPYGGLEIELELATGGPVEVVLVARGSGLPAAGSRLETARGRLWVPVGRGDETLSVCRVRI
jgi:hypothetical protein